MSKPLAQKVCRYSFLSAVLMVFDHIWQFVHIHYYFLDPCSYTKC